MEAFGDGVALRMVRGGVSDADSMGPTEDRHQVRTEFTGIVGQECPRHPIVSHKRSNTPNYLLCFLERNFFNFTNLEK